MKKSKAPDTQFDMTHTRPQPLSQTNAHLAQRSADNTSLDRHADGRLGGDVKMLSFGSAAA